MAPGLESYFSDKISHVLTVAGFLLRLEPTSLSQPKVTVPVAGEQDI